MEGEENVAVPAAVFRYDEKKCKLKTYPINFAIKSEIYIFSYITAVTFFYKFYIFKGIYKEYI